MLAEQRRAADLRGVPPQELVRDRERPEFSAARVLGAQARRHFPQREIPRRCEREQGDLSIEHREVDLASVAGAAAPGERGEDGDRDPESGSEIGDRQTRLHGAAAALAGEAEDAAHRLEHRVVALLVLVRPGLAEAGARDIDQPRVEAGQRGEVEPLAAERAGRKVLDQHVGLLRQLANQLAAVVGAQIHRDGLLRPVAGEVIGAVARQLRLEAARLVAAAGLLDLDDARAELGDDHRRERTGEHARKIEDGDAFERFHPLSSFSKLRMRLLTSRPRSSAVGSGRSTTPWNSLFVCAIAGRLAAPSLSARRRVSVMRAESGTTRFTMPSSSARAALIGSPSATSSKAALWPIWRTRFAITIAATMPCLVSG